VKRRAEVDRAIYLVDDDTKTYTFLERNSDWNKLDPTDNENNEKSIDGYMRIFRDGSKKVFRFR